MLIVQPQNREDNALLTWLIYKPTVSVYTNNIELSSFFREKFHFRSRRDGTIHILHRNWKYQNNPLQIIGSRMGVSILGNSLSWPKSWSFQPKVAFSKMFVSSLVSTIPLSKYAMVIWNLQNRKLFQNLNFFFIPAFPWTQPFCPCPRQICWGKQSINWSTNQTVDQSINYSMN